MTNTYLSTLRLTCGLAFMAVGLMVALTQVTPTHADGICDSVTEIPQSECEALEAFYTATNGDDWNRNDGWLISNTPCDGDDKWYGVSCVGSGDDQYVSGLDLEKNNLRGTLPHSMTALPQLTVLWLPENAISGTIPSEIGQLSKLQSLKLNSNDLEGGIPPTVVNLTKLETLDLHDNTLSERIPTNIGNLTALQTLDLSNNLLDHGIPTSIGNLSQLEQLLLFQNQLSGAIPSEIGNLTELKMLNLRNNRLSGPIPTSLGNLSHLTALYLNDNWLTGELPMGLGNLTNLKVLSLKKNKLEGVIPTSIGNLVNLTELYLHQNELNGTIPTELGNLGHLVQLRLNHNHLRGNIPATFGNLTQLRQLDLGSNRLMGPIPPQLGNLTQLGSLGLNSNALSGELPTSLLNLTQAKLIDLHYNMLTHNNPDMVAFTRPLDSNRANINWIRTQNITPINVQATAISNTQIQVSWSPISYTFSEFIYQVEGYGHYEISYATAPTGPYTVAGRTDSKAEAKYLVDKLNPDTTYYFAIRTYTPPHNGGPQQNVLLSEYSSPVSASTTITSFCAENNVTEIPMSECQALETLYISTSGSNWLNSTNWLQTITPCDWYGITCEDGHVTEVGLSQNKLVGLMPTNLDRLTELTVLDLSSSNMERVERNNLGGPLPVTLAHLSKLKKLWLKGNSLTGSIPPELGNLTNLSQLSLSSNLLTGQIPTTLGNLSNLNDLYLSGNRLTGLIPPELGNLSSLLHLHLNNNQLSGSIPPELGNLSQLNTLYLQYNYQLEGKLPATLGQLKQLKQLDVAKNQLSGSIPPELGKLEKLTKFNAEFNNLSEELPPELGNCRSLVHLALSYNAFTGSIPASFGNLTNLTDLWIRDAGLSGPIPSELGNLTKLRILLLHDNQLSGPIPTELGKLTDLQSLKLDNNQLSGPIPPVLGNLQKLNTLRLDNNALTGPIPIKFNQLQRLIELTLDNNQLTGSIPSELSQLQTLSQLSLNANQLTGPIPPELGQLSNLIGLGLSNNPLSNALPNSLMNLPRLSGLSFENTNICEPPAMQAWLDGLTRLGRTNVTCPTNLGILTIIHSSQWPLATPVRFESDFGTFALATNAGQTFNDLSPKSYAVRLDPTAYPDDTWSLERISCRDSTNQNFDLIFNPAYQQVEIPVQAGQYLTCVFHSHTSPSEIPLLKQQTVLPKRIGNRSLVYSGDTLVYQISLSNSLSVPIFFEVQDHWSTQVDYLSGTLQINGQPVSDTLYINDRQLFYTTSLTLNPAESFMISFAVQVQPDIPGQIIRNTAEVTVCPDIGEVPVCQTQSTNTVEAVVSSTIPATSLTLIKKANEQPATGVFSFTGDLGAFELAADKAITFTDLASGTYSIQESNRQWLSEQYWALISVSCVDKATGHAAPQSVMADLSNYQADITLTAGQQLTCIFENNRADFEKGDTVGRIFIPLIRK